MMKAVLYLENLDVVEISKVYSIRHKNHKIYLFWEYATDDGLHKSSYSWDETEVNHMCVTWGKDDE